MEKLDRKLQTEANWARRKIRHTIVSIASIVAVLAFATSEELIFKGALIVLCIFGIIPIIMAEDTRESEPYKTKPYMRVLSVLGIIAYVIFLLVDAYHHYN